MDKKHKLYLKLNLMSLFFVALSFVSITLAWFAYSGIGNVATEIGVKAWNIEFKNNDDTVANDIVISLSDIYPGMETVSEKVDINNLGDSDAQVSYKIDSARVFDYDLTDLENLEDKMSHEYPFHINISLSKDYAEAKGGHSELEVSISWPLDSDNNELDSKWGNAAFEFQNEELNKHNQDNSYQIRPTLKIVINLTAEQFIETNESPDKSFNLGDLILYDVIDNKVCTELSSSCISTYVIDVNNKIGDTTVSLLPDLFKSYGVGKYTSYDTLLNTLAGRWNVNLRAATVEDILKPISKDVVNSVMVRENLSNNIIGNLNDSDRLTTEINKLINYNGYFKYSNSKFPYLASNKCYWVKSDYGDGAFAFMKIDDNYSKIYKEDVTTSCTILPIIEVSKSNLIV